MLAFVLDTLFNVYMCMWRFKLPATLAAGFECFPTRLMRVALRSWRALDCCARRNAPLLFRHIR